MLSVIPDLCMQIQFMYNHHLLQISGKPSWLTLRGGRSAYTTTALAECSCFSYTHSQVYVKRILSKLPASQLHLSKPVQSVKTRHGKGRQVELTTASGDTFNYDHVIFACHSDTALSILEAGGTVTHEEARILGHFEWNKNVVVLHNDSAVSILYASPLWAPND